MLLQGSGDPCVEDQARMVRLTAARSVEELGEERRSEVWNRRAAGPEELVGVPRVAARSLRGLLQQGTRVVRIPSNGVDALTVVSVSSTGAPAQTDPQQPPRRLGRLRGRIREREQVRP